MALKVGLGVIFPAEMTSCLPDLQGPIRLETVQCQDAIHGDVIGFGNCVQRLIRPHFMDDPAICIRGLGDDHAIGSRRGVALRVLPRDE